MYYFYITKGKLMKNLVMVVLTIMLMGTGCSSQKIMGYIDEPQTILKDPHYEEHKAKLEQLEKSYLAGEMEYDQYLLKKKEMEDEYAKEVQEREAIIRGDDETVR